MYEEYDVYSERIIAVLAISLVCLATFAVLKSAHYIVKYLGASGINAISLIIGLC
ncbi:MAG: hypothetical protein MUP24_14995 [Gillisia sp.]|nr:hypothetical protein [Gillisia sp.]